jgi:hypothetical protein
VHSTDCGQRPKEQNRTDDVHCEHRRMGRKGWE